MAAALVALQTPAVAARHSSGASSLPAPVPIQTLASTTWQGMEILAQASTPLPFIVFDGTSEHIVEPTRQDSMHLMVMLSVQHTGAPIPYASVWATIRTASGRVVYDERQWPMIGRYKLTLLISPPVAARPMGLAHVWAQPHRVTLTFDWHPPKPS